MRRTKLTILGALVAALTIAAPTAGVTSSRDLRADVTSSDGVLDTQSAIVVLNQLPIATYDGKIKGYEKTRDSNGKLNPNSAAAKKYLGYLKTGHSAFAKWLQANVPSAKITSEYFTVLNGVAVSLNGAAIGKLRENADVLVVEYNALYRPTMSESYKLIDAVDAWTAAGGRTEAGRGVKVGIIDSGIDSSHPFFDETGFTSPDGFPKCDAQDSASGRADSDCKYVTEKVIVAKVFNNKLNQSGFDANPTPGVGDHGTHVSGTVAGVVGKTAVVNGVQIDDMSGIAPAAWLGNYNVFPGTVENARSEDILNAVEAAVLDGMDVLNLSLGGGYHGNNDLLAKGLDTAVAAGVVVVTSAGNEGPGPFTIGSPGRARDIITVGASTNQHFVGQPVSWITGPDGSTTTVGAAVGDFPALTGSTFELVVALKDGALDDACLGLPAASGTSPQAVLVTRGTCSFSTKVRAAKAAGYDAVLVRNNVAGDPTAMGTDGLGNDDLPAVMLSRADGDDLRTTAPSHVSATATFSEFLTDNGDILAGFSSQGPTLIDYAIKPDLTSVGVNVLSSVAGGGAAGNWAFFSGTSMSSPHVTGSAAVLLGLYPAWTPAQVKSALVNTAERVVTDASTGLATVGPMAQGAGRENLGLASSATVSFTPVSASFGRISASNNRPTSTTITISNTSLSPVTFDLSAKKFTPAPGRLGSVYNGGNDDEVDERISFPSTVTVGAGGTTTLTISVNAGLPNGTVVQGWLEASGGGRTYGIAYWAQVGP